MRGLFKLAGGLFFASVSYKSTFLLAITLTNLPVWSKILLRQHNGDYTGEIRET